MRIIGTCSTRWWAAPAVLGLAVVSLSCSKDDPVDRLTAPGTGTEEAFNVVVTSGDGFGVPTGSISHTAFRLAFVPPGETDVFGRATGAFGFYGTPFTGCPGYNLRSPSALARNASGDPRSPLLGDADAGVGSFATFLSPACIGEGFWDLFIAVNNLQPTTAYTVMLVRYGLEVRGALDVAQVLLGEAVDQPDSLFLLGGTPGGYPETVCDFSVFDNVVPRGVNPLVGGTFVTNDVGVGTIDCVFFSSDTDPTWWRSDAAAIPPGAADSLPLAANEAGAFDLTTPTYNYIVVVEGVGTPTDPVPAGPHVLRFQVGVDLDAAGSPIPDTYAPYPITRLTAAQLDAVRGVLHPTASQVSFSGLPPLTGGYAYKMWLMNMHVSPPTFAQAIGSLVETTDAGAQPAETTAVFNPAAATSSFAVTVNPATAGVPLPDYSHFVITYESDPVATTPSSRQFIFHQYINRSGTDADFSDDRVSAGALILGAPAANLDGFSRRWGLAGTGLAQYFGDEFRARVTQFARPPLGFFFDGWLVGRDTLGNTFYRRIGPLTRDDPPTYTSLFDADTSRASGVVTETFVAEAISLVPSVDALNIPPEALKTRSDGSTQHGYCAIMEYWITLEPKDGRPANPTAPGPTVAAVGETPETFQRSPLCR